MAIAIAAFILIAGTQKPSGQKSRGEVTVNQPSKNVIALQWPTIESESGVGRVLGATIEEEMSQFS